MSTNLVSKACPLVLLASIALAAPSAAQTSFTQAACAKLTTDEQRAACEKALPEADRLQRENVERESQVVYPYALAGEMPTGVVLVAGTDNKTASLTYAVPLGALSSLSLAATAPLSDADPRTSIIQLSGLANKGTVGAQWTRGWQRRPTPARADALLTSLLAACGQPAPKPSTPGGPGISEGGCDMTTLGRQNAVVRALLPEYVRTAWFASLKGELGRQTFAWIDETSFVDDKDTKYPASGSFTIGALTTSNVFVSAGIRLENGYADRDQQAVCGPAQAGLQQACPLNIVGGPENTRRGIFEGEVRKFLSTSEKHPIGLSTVVRWDWMNDEVSAEVPVYLVKDKDGGLSGGISAGYVWSDTPVNRGARLSVFVGQTFGLVPSGK